MMYLEDRIRDALQKHGPMTGTEIYRRIGIGARSSTGSRLSIMAKAGSVVRLGTSMDYPGATIWGLPIPGPACPYC